MLRSGAGERAEPRLKRGMSARVESTMPTNEHPTQTRDVSLREFSAASQAEVLRVRKQTLQSCLGDAWSPPFAEGPIDDDTGNRDEDLHDRNDIIWGIDSPGAPTQPAGTDFSAQEWVMTETVHLILNDTEINWSAPKTGILVSGEFYWYAIWHAKKDPATGVWIRNDDARNEIREGTITIGDTPHE